MACGLGDDDGIVVRGMSNGSGAPRLMERVRAAIRARHHSRRTEEAYVHWIRRYIAFHRFRHPQDLGAVDIAAFLNWLAVERRVAGSTQNQALSAVLFMYRRVLRVEVGNIGVPHASVPQRVPVVLSVDEVRRVLKELSGVSLMVASLLYGAGLRLHECLELRVKDIDFGRCEIVVRRGKGDKDRRVMLPERLVPVLQAHLAAVERQHQADRAAGFGRVVLPGALERKLTGAPFEWRWQFVFPAARLCRDPRFGPPTGFHLHPSAVQRAVTQAGRRAGLAKRVTCHTMPFVLDALA